MRHSCIDNRRPVEVLREIFLSSGVQESRGDTSNGEEQGMCNRLPFGGVFGEVTKAPEEAHLYVRKRVHVGVPEADGSLQDWGVVEEMLLVGYLKQ